MDDRFMLEIAGDGFTLTMQGSGDSASAAAAAALAFEGCAVVVLPFGDAVDMSGQ